MTGISLGENFAATKIKEVQAAIRTRNAPTTNSQGRNIGMGSLGLTKKVWIRAEELDLMPDGGVAGFGMNLQGQGAGPGVGAVGNDHDERASELLKRVQMEVLASPGEDKSRRRVLK